MSTNEKVGEGRGFSAALFAVASIGLSGEKEGLTRKFGVGELEASEDEVHLL